MAKTMVPLAPGWRAVWITGKVASVAPVPALVWDSKTESAYAVLWDNGAWLLCDGGSYVPPDGWLAPGDEDEDALEFVDVERVERPRG